MKRLIASLTLVFGFAVMAATDAEKQGSGMMNASCPSRSEAVAGGVKVVFLGNSITLHAPAPKVGWMNDWGMAASARERDYVHLVARAIGEKTGRPVDLRIRNLADFERHYRSWDVERNLSDLIAFRPDYLVVALGENVPTLACGGDIEDFRKAFLELLTAFRRKGARPRGVVRGVFWRNPIKDEQMHRAAQEVGFPFVRADIADEPGMKATGTAVHPGVQNHPGDRGMAETAARIVAALFPTGDVARFPSTALPAGVNFAGDPLRRNFSLDAEDVEVRVDGRRREARAIRVSAHPFNRVWPGHQRPLDQTDPSAYVAFEKDGPAAFEVRPKGGCRTAVVRPISAGVKPVVKDGAVSFAVPTNGCYTVEFDDAHRTLHVFSEPPRDFAEYGPPTRAFGPGVHQAGVIEVKSGDRIYIDRDAVVYGRLVGRDVTDVKVFGGGVLDGSTCERVFDSGYTPLQPYGIAFFRSRGVTVDGPVLVNCAYWCAALFDCENVDVSHLKIVGQWRYNTDGIDICNSRHVRVRDCFVRSFDDAVCVKGVLPFADRPVEDVSVERCVLWCGWGNTCEIGVETHALQMKGIRFEDCDLVRNAAIALDVGCGGKTTVDDVLFRNLRVEFPRDAEQMVLQKSEDARWKVGPAGSPVLACVRATPYGKDGGGGKVGKVVFGDIRVFADEGVERPLVRVAAGTDVRLPSLDATLRLETTTPVLLDFGPDGTAGYPEIEARPVRGSPRVRLSYGCYPAFGRNGDFWRETSARYLGKDFDLPILPANVNRFDVFAVTNSGTYSSPLQQGLQRYVRVQLEEPNAAVDISAVRFANRGTHSEEPVVGSFACSDERLTALWKASVRTCQLAAIPARTEPLHLVTPETNVVLGTTYAYLSDGAKRDRLVWSGDLWWSQYNMYAAFASDSPYLPGSLRMLAENQTPEGYVQACPYPESHGPLADGDYGPFPSDEFAAWFVPVLAAHYLHTGDRRLVEELYPNVRRLLAYLARHTRDDFIFEQRLETSKHANGLAFGTSSVHHRSFVNVLLWRTFRDAATLADACGEAKDADGWRMRALRSAAVTRERFFLPTGLLRTSLEDANPGLEATALALGAEFFTPDEAKRALEALPRVGHGKFQLLAVRGAFAYGLPDEAVRRIAEHDWLKMADPAYKGIHTTTECMQFRTKCSWGDEAHPDTALAGDLTRGILGIRPLEPGYARFAFEPNPPAGIDWAEGVVPTPKGPIRASWRRVNGQIKKTLDCPEQLQSCAGDGLRRTFSNGTVATCQLPVADGDFGKDAFGWLEARTTVPGTYVVRLGEQRLADGTVNVRPQGTIRGCAVTCEVSTAWTRVPLIPDKRNTTGVNGKAIAVALPAEVGVVMPFRYAEKASGPGELSFRRHFVHWPMACKMTCPVDAADAKRVWDFCQYSIVATSFAGLMVDGDRERIPYEGDIYINMLGQLYGVDGDPELSRRSIRHVLKYPTWPTEWKQHAIMCVWEDWRFTKSTALAAECYDLLRDEKLMLERARADGLLPSDTGDIVDWPPAERDGYDMKTPCNTVVNAFHYRNLLEMSDLAAALGKAEEARRFRTRAEKVRARFNEVFFDAKRGLYVDGEGSRHVSLHANAAALDFGLVPADRQADVVAFIADRGMACSPYFAQYYLEALCKFGRKDVALKLMTAKGDRGWLGMLEQGTTMTMEAWSLKAKPNQDWNHAWGTVPLNILARFFSGVTSRAADARRAW